MTPSDTARPASVSAAAALFLVYGIAAVVVAAMTQGWAGWVEAGSIPRALLRLAAAGVIAWGLMRGAPWAWLVGLALAILWLIAGLAPVLVMEHGDVRWLPPSGDQLVLAAGLAGLVVAVVLLVTPSARRWLREEGRNR
jgi:hypothetical protein